MEIHLMPQDTPEDVSAIVLDGLRLTDPRFETDGFWLLCTWEAPCERKRDGMESERCGICLVDGDCEGFDEPRDEDAAIALVKIIDEVYERFQAICLEGIESRTIPSMLKEAWFGTREAVKAYKAQPKRRTPQV